MHTERLTPLVCLALPLALVPACAEPLDQARAELAALEDRVPAFQAIRLPAAGVLRLTAEQSVTVDALRGVALDPTPPEPGPPAAAYDPRMTDDWPAGEAPYVAEGILPFRFDRFHNEFNYGGWHNWAMKDYAAAHGFDILSIYNRQPADLGHHPDGTQYLSWSGFVDWHKWLPENGYPEGRYDLLADVDLVGKLVEQEVFKPRPEFEYLMIDLEHGLLRPEQLRQQAWYPNDAAPAERTAFEQRYYDGYAKTYTAPVAAARQAGFRNISLYGWQPFDRNWFGLAEATVDPATDPAWNAYGKTIYESVDLLNPSVYCFYWSPQNVAYTLANIDLNRKLVESTGDPKPIRPYYWTLLHGGGGGWRWWANQALPNEEVRAMTALAFFTGIDGIDTWNWSGTGNHHRPELKAETDEMVGEPFAAPAEGDGPAGEFARYDPIRILTVAEDGAVRFQKVLPAELKQNYGVGAGFPVYLMPKADLAPKLRARSEPISAQIEGLALVKPFENLLRDGTPRLDVDSQKTFAKTLPIVRRVELGPYHLLATYDPLVISGGEPRTVTLENFAGQVGLTVTLPADDQVRLFLLEEE